MKCVLPWQEVKDREEVEGWRGGGGGVIYKIVEESLVAEAKWNSKSHGVALNQIQAVLSEKSSSSLLHEVHIKGGL